MKILFLSSWYPTDSNPNDGIFVKEHAHAIHCVGNEIVVLSLVIKKNNFIFNKLYSEFKDDYGVRTICVELQTRFYDILYHAAPIQYLYLKHVSKILIKSGFLPEIIHSNVVFPAGVLGNWLSKSLKIPHIITEHWSRLPRFMKKPVLSSWATAAYCNAKFILPVSSFLKNRIQITIPILSEQKFRIVGNVVDDKTFYFKKKNNNTEIIQFCAIATWAHKKNPDKLPELFIDALYEIQKSINQKIRLTMIGGGDKIEELQTLCMNKNINATFTGYIPKNEIVKHLHAADFLIHASTIETFGVGIAEALMTGTPVICSRVGALAELIDDSNGVLCENSVHDWALGLMRAITLKYNHQKIAEKIKVRFNQNVIGQEISAVYLNAIGTKTR